MRIQRKRRTLGPAALGLGVFAISVALIAPGAIGAPPSCAVSNTRDHKGYNAVQQAVNAAKAGDTLEVKGNCVGNTSVDKDITLEGVTNKAFPGTPTLDGGGTGTVLHITNGTTTIDGLTIRHGVASVFSPENDACCVGGGIALTGDTAAARVVDSLVTGNSSSLLFGGGIDVDDGTLMLVNSTVSGNTASSSGGIDSDFGTITLVSSAVTGNVATGGGTCTSANLSCAGGIWNFGGTLTLIDSTVTGNTAANRGGGIVNQTPTGAAAAQLTLSGSTTISSNTASEFGGGIWFRGSVVGVSATPDWTGSVSGNTPDQCSPTVTLGGTSCGGP